VGFLRARREGCVWRGEGRSSRAGIFLGTRRFCSGSDKKSPRPPRRPWATQNPRQPPCACFPGQARDNNSRRGPGPSFFFSPFSGDVPTGALASEPFDAPRRRETLNPRSSCQFGPEKYGASNTFAGIVLRPTTPEHPRCPHGSGYLGKKVANDLK